MSLVRGGEDEETERQAMVGALLVAEGLRYLEVLAKAFTRK